MGGGGALSSPASIVFSRPGCAAAGAGRGGAAGTWIRCPQAGQLFFVPASLTGASRDALQRGQLYVIDGAVSPIIVLA
jgi:hypothetical protein